MKEGLPPGPKPGVWAVKMGRPGCRTGDCSTIGDEEGTAGSTAGDDSGGVAADRSGCTAAAVATSGDCRRLPMTDPKPSSLRPLCGVCVDTRFLFLLLHA
jgi:hypothetical protein